jgi:hypothetical protein
MSTTQFAICWLMRLSALALRSSCKVISPSGCAAKSRHDQDLAHYRQFAPECQRFARGRAGTDNPRMRRASRGPTSLGEVYGRLVRHRGHAGWWPARSAFEVCVGAILVQNTAWTNVEKALQVLRCAPPPLLRCAARDARVGDRAADPQLRMLQRQGPAIARFPRFPRPGSTAGASEQWRRKSPCPAREAARRGGHRAGDGRFDRALRGGTAPVRDRRLHPAGLRPPGSGGRGRAL